MSKHTGSEPLLLAHTEFTNGEHMLSNHANNIRSSSRRRRISSSSIAIRVGSGSLEEAAAGFPAEQYSASR